MNKRLLFDLDGTLTDSSEGIINSVLYALRKHHITEDNHESLRAFIGPPLIDSFMQKYNVSQNKAEQMTTSYREYFSEKGIYENKLYDGISDMLRDLKANSFRCFLATSKPKVYAEKILKHFNIFTFFTAVYGPQMDGKHNSKTELLAWLLEKEKLHPSQCIMIGDRKYDMQAARDNGIFATGVSYGFGSHEELMTSGAGHIVDSVRELKSFLRGQE